MVLHKGLIGIKSDMSSFLRIFLDKESTTIVSGCTKGTRRSLQEVPERKLTYVKSS